MCSCLPPSTSVSVRFRIVSVTGSGLGSSVSRGRGGVRFWILDSELQLLSALVIDDDIELSSFSSLSDALGIVSGELNNWGINLYGGSTSI